jgi:hypothetical protein
MSKRGLSARHNASNQTLIMVNKRLPKGILAAANGAAAPGSRLAAAVAARSPGSGAAPTAGSLPKIAKTTPCKVECLDRQPSCRMCPRRKMAHRRAPSDPNPALGRHPFGAVKSKPLFLFGSVLLMGQALLDIECPFSSGPIAEARAAKTKPPVCGSQTGGCVAVRLFGGTTPGADRPRAGSDAACAAP